MSMQGFWKCYWYIFARTYISQGLQFHSLQLFIGHKQPKLRAAGLRHDIQVLCPFHCLVSRHTLSSFRLLDQLTGDPHLQPTYDICPALCAWLSLVMGCSHTCTGLGSLCEMGPRDRWLRIAHCPAHLPIVPRAQLTMYRAADSWHRMARHVWEHDGQRQLAKLSQV